MERPHVNGILLNSATVVSHFQFSSCVLFHQASSFLIFIALLSDKQLTAGEVLDSWVQCYTQQSLHLWKSSACSQVGLQNLSCSLSSSASWPCGRWIYNPFMLRKQLMFCTCSFTCSSICLLLLFILQIFISASKIFMVIVRFQDFPFFTFKVRSSVLRVAGDVRLGRGRQGKAEIIWFVQEAFFTIF